MWLQSLEKICWEPSSRDFQRFPTCFRIPPGIISWAFTPQIEQSWNSYPGMLRVASGIHLHNVYLFITQIFSQFHFSCVKHTFIPVLLASPLHVYRGQKLDRFNAYTGFQKLLCNGHGDGYQWIRKKIQDTPIFHGNIDSFRLRFSLKPIHSG